MKEPILLDIKPLTVNRAWQGKRYKSPAYKAFREEMMLILPPIDLPEPPFEIWYEWGVSSQLSDFDNPIKTTTDALQQRYGFNDRDIIQAHIRKCLVPKGKEYIKFKIKTLDE